MSKIDIKEFVKSDSKTDNMYKAKHKVDDRVTNLIGGVVLLGIVLSIIGVWTGIRAVANWGATHEILGQRVIDLQVRWPFRVETRKPLVLASIEKKALMPELGTDIEKYICEKWGLVECRTALAIAEAESNLNCNAFNVNTNGSVDFSIFQLNSVHLKKGGEWTLENMANCKKNVDLAYQLWTEQGWEPWVAYLSNAYLAKY
jgi:hypothetical protein